MLKVGEGYKEKTVNNVHESGVFLRWRVKRITIDWKIRVGGFSINFKRVLIVVTTKSRIKKIDSGTAYLYSKYNNRVKVNLILINIVRKYGDSIGKCDFIIERKKPFLKIINPVPLRLCSLHQFHKDSVPIRHVSFINATTYNLCTFFDSSFKVFDKFKP